MTDPSLENRVSELEKAVALLQELVSTSNLEGEVAKTEKKKATRKE